ncbi:hypothetical protein AX774_g2528, partial [Zancudomyces culisetae]
MERYIVVFRKGCADNLRTSALDSVAGM